MMQTVQLSISDGAYAAAVREALCRSCAWQIESVDRPDISRDGVLVLDESAFERLPRPLSNPERVVLIARKDTHEMMALAWEAGIVSVVSVDDPMSTIQLAIMAAALRVAKSHGAAASSGISPSPAANPAQITPQSDRFTSKRCKIR